MECYVSVTCDSYLYSTLIIKKHTKLEKRAFDFQQTVCEEFSDISNLMAKGIKYLKY